MESRFCVEKASLRSNYLPIPRQYRGEYVCLSRRRPWFDPQSRRFLPIVVRMRSTSPCARTKIVPSGQPDDTQPSHLQLQLVFLIAPIRMQENCVKEGQLKGSTSLPFVHTHCQQPLVPIKCYGWQIGQQLRSDRECCHGNDFQTQKQEKYQQGFRR